MELTFEKSQHGFSKDKSCLTNLITFNKKETLSVHIGTAACILCLDFKKAFDTVSFSLLLGKLTRERLDEWSSKWVGDCVTGHTQKVVLNGFYSDWQLVADRLLPSIGTGRVLFSVFIYGPDDWIESIFAKFTDGTRMSGEVDMSEGKAILRRELDGLEEWESKNCAKFNKGRSFTWDYTTREPSTGKDLCDQGAVLLKEACSPSGPWIPF